jgi:hypothetical protein
MNMSGLKWVKVVLSGARDKYGEIISKNFDYNKFNTKNKQNKSNQNQINLKLNQKEIKRNKFGFPVMDDN